MNTNNNCPEKITYGWDNFSKILTFIGCIFCLLTAYEAFLGLLMISYAFWRSRSKNVMKRTREERLLLKFLNDAFRVIYNIRHGRISLKNLRLKNRKRYKKCPRCGNLILLKTTTKNNVLSCPKCSLKFKAK
ncbi:hypothetical protein [Clostridium sp. HV4-5-A1G]|uniref:hypothetical protein n=1 Tax=Clostridium sp. HV4-5-A1G TaxID=2004595 RepID=UPI001238CA06|nr:hypothetical protein [Clostridium sp. HV4-5-A1G]KAA8668780.1 hypothetical protein F3O63_14075 [Clostridium sp. HV4-5-A1G]